MKVCLLWALFMNAAPQGFCQILLQTIQLDSDVKELAWHPDGTFLAAAGGNIITVLNETYAVIETLTTLRPSGSGFYDSFKEAVHFSSDGRYMCTGSDDQTTEIYSTTDFALVQDLEDAGPFCRFSPDSTEIATTGEFGFDNEDLQIWAVDSWIVTTTPVDSPEGAFFLEWSPDGTMLAADDPVTRSILIFETSTWTRIRSLSGVFDYDAMAWSPDSTLLAVSGGTRPQGAIQIYNVSSWEVIEELIAHDTQFVRAIAFSPTGSQFVSGGDNGTVFLWSTDDWEIRGSLDRHTSVIRSLAYSRDGTKLASGGNEMAVYVWDPAIVTQAPSAAPSVSPGATPAPAMQATCSLCAGGASPPDPNLAITFFDRLAGETVETTCGELAVSDRFLFREGTYCYDDQLFGMDRCGCEPPIPFCDSICADPNGSPVAACGRARNIFFSQQFKYLLYDVDGKEYDQATCDFNRFVAYANDVGCDCDVSIDSCAICSDGSAISPSQDEAGSCERIQASLVQVPSSSGYCPVVQALYGIRCGCTSGPSQTLPVDNQCSFCGDGQVKSAPADCASIVEPQKFLPADTYLCDAEKIRQVTSIQGCCEVGAPQEESTEAPTVTPAPSRTSSATPSVDPTAAPSLVPSGAMTTTNPTVAPSTAPSSIVSSAAPSSFLPSEAPSMSPPTSSAGVYHGEICALLYVVAFLLVW